MPRLVRTAAAGPLALHIVDRSGRGLLVAGEYVECYVDINVPRVLKQQIDAIKINVAGLVTSYASLLFLKVVSPYQLTGGSLETRL